VALDDAEPVAVAFPVFVYPVELFIINTEEYAEDVEMAVDVEIAVYLEDVEMISEADFI
jgi:hypothetical protein